jgi:hypothetical protein
MLLDDSLEFSTEKQAQTLEGHKKKKAGRNAELTE